MGSLLPARADNGLIVRTMLVAYGAVFAVNMFLRCNARITDGGFLAEELVLTVVVILSKATVPPLDAVCFDFLGDGGRILAKRVGNAGITHFVIQRILDEMPVIIGQMFVLFHARYLLNPRRSRKRIA